MARAGSLDVTVAAQGRIGPPSGSAAKLAFAQAGIVESIDVRVGERIGAGDSIAQLDRAALAAPLAQARADVRSAEAGYAGGAVAASGVRSAVARLVVANSRLDSLGSGGPAALGGRISAQAVARQAALKVAGDRALVVRQERLFAAGVVARKDLETARLQLASDVADVRAADAKVSVAANDFTAALAQARADVAIAKGDLAAARPQNRVLAEQVSSARAKLAAASVAYENGIIAAPSGGIVLAILKRPGEYVDPSTPIVEIGPAAGGTVTLSVPSDIARRIAPGNLVTMRVANSAGRPTLGRIAAVVPVVDPAVQAVTIVASGAPSGAVPGDAVSATITVGRANGTIVPATAIVEDPETGKSVVFVRRNGSGHGEPAFAMRAVDVRASDASQAAIGAGLRPGETVAAQGGYALLAPAGG